MVLPDIIGFCLGDSKRVLARNSIENLEIIPVRPPRKLVWKTDEQIKECQPENGYDNNSRVITAHLTGEGKVRLLVCNIKTLQ